MARRPRALLRNVAMTDARGAGRNLRAVVHARRRASAAWRAGSERNAPNAAQRPLAAGVVGRRGAGAGGSGQLLLRPPVLLEAVVAPQPAGHTQEAHNE